MNIGYAMLYPYRGSIHNMIYFAKLMQSDGHTNFFLKCSASVPFCYNRIIKGRSKIVECTKCYLGGVDSFGVKNVTAIDSKLSVDLNGDMISDIVNSSSYSIHRIETDEDCVQPDVLDTQNKLRPLAQIVYANALKFIESNNLDLVFIFNGRLDMPRAVLKACEAKNIPYITFEAAYPGVALEVNDDCRSLKSLHLIISRFIDLPMMRRQAVFAAEIARKMLAKKNFVWRLYNTNPVNAFWPASGVPRILIVPSSNHEFKGVRGWTSAWSHPLIGINEVLKHLNVEASNCVVRCHPNWSENIGVSHDGYKSERIYLDWADKSGAALIPSHSKINTIDLIREADYVIVQYGTAGIEAGLLGKKVIGLSPSWYSNSGFSAQVHSSDDLGAISLLDLMPERRIVTLALRFLYCYHARFSQFVRYIQPLSVYENLYKFGAKSDKIFAAVDQNHLIADDDVVASDEIEEGIIVDKFISGDFDVNISDEEIDDFRDFEPIHRAGLFRIVDLVRSKLKGGDR